MAVRSAGDKAPRARAVAVARDREGTLSGPVVVGRRMLRTQATATNSSARVSVTNPTIRVMPPDAAFVLSAGWGMGRGRVPLQANAAYCGFLRAVLNRVVLGTLHGIGQYRVCHVDRAHLPGSVSLLIEVGMVAPSQSTVGLRNLILRCRTWHAKDGIEVSCCWHLLPRAALYPPRAHVTSSGSRRSDEIGRQARIPSACFTTWRRLTAGVVAAPSTPNVAVVGALGRSVGHTRDLGLGGVGINVDGLTASVGA